jgi:S-formylglutathione hydrolase
METLKEHVSFGGRQSFHRHESDVIGLSMRLSVYTPPGKGPFPVLVFLSGLTCTEENFTTKAGAQRLAAELGLILVMPDTSPRGAGVPGEDDRWDLGTGAGFYVDATEAPWSRHYRMYSYVTEELVALIDRHFPTAGPKSIFGHSMGGHGALVIGLRQPDAWRSISAFSPICHPTACPWGHTAFGHYLGNDREAWRAYDATELVASRQHPAPILIDQGLADDFLAEQLLPAPFQRASSESGQALTYRAHAGYDHSYYFIATFVDDHLRHHARYLAA